MKKRSKVWIAAFILGTLVILLSAVWVYKRQLSSTTESSVVAFMEELSNHDMQNIQNELENSWEELSAIYDRTLISDCKTVQQVCNRLNIERRSNAFDMIYLVDAEGNTYSSSNMIKNSKDKSYVKPILSGKEKFVLRYDNMGLLETMREDLVYGIRSEPFEVDGKEFIGIVGFSKLSMMADRLKIDSFNGRGYVGIIDVDGNYVVNSNRNVGIGKIENYFTNLQQNAGLSKEKVTEIISRLENKETFLEHFDYGDRADTQVASFIPITDTTWSIVLTVPEEVFNEQTQQFVAMTTIMLAVVVIVLCLMMLAIIRVSVKSATAKAEAESSGAFLSSMSHEIRTPLNGMIGLNYLMQQNLGDPEKLRNYLGKSDATAKYLLALVSDILDMSKLRAGKMELRLKPLSVGSLISTVESIMRDRMDEKNISFEIETDLPSPDICGDEMRIEQILLNILGNAAKFTPEGGAVTMRVFQSAAGENKVTTTYRIEDTGCGMSEEFQAKIFDSFSQEHNDVSAGTQGTGLGMSISSLLAKQMGGTLSVESRLGVGSCFTFTMTADIVDQEPDAVVTAEETSEKPDSPKKLNILVAEDNLLNTEILIEMLNAAGFSTSHAADGEQVVDLFASSEPYAFDVILMDVQMPVRSGYEATEIIRQMNRPDAKSIMIFACTANTFKEDEDKAFQCGMNGFIAKPIDLNKLMEKLNGINQEGTEK